MWKEFTGGEKKIKKSWNIFVHGVHFFQIEQFLEIAYFAAK